MNNFIEELYIKKKTLPKNKNKIVSREMYKNQNQLLYRFFFHCFLCLILLEFILLFRIKNFKFKT